MENGVFLLLFIEGILAFISPCFLPLLPVYLTYLTGQGEEQSRRKVLLNSLGFIAGFTLVFVALGMTATSLSQFFISRRLLFQRLGGAILILFGLNMAGILKIGLLNRQARFDLKREKEGFLSSLLFGVVISFGWSPCLGAFLGAALLQAANAGTVWLGGLKLLVFSLGLGLPFLVTALLFNNLTTVFAAIRRHYRTISLVSGLFLIVLGVLMLLDRFTFYANIFY